ncbi:MAG: ABC transporter permease [Dehalococcoidia bacterium]|uniref:ABC transporter permease n=1 Tax=Candidatus Amarobacter glycogenicus TaxID=3140699 RepID=UPI001D8F1E33|nr:ABC transporter permease [Dehalococcoidia bacterium]MBK7126725.1 ABC transporter permease [Dehalococcoidia bacterium]MBK7725365.1 ABC transporter permease [Dehalococcoidia bacterium]
MASSTDALVLEQYALRREKPFHERIRAGLWRFITKKPLGAFGGFIVIMFLLMAIAPAIFATHDPNPSPPPILERLQGPSAEHWFGTDQFGRDVYSRIIYGARTSMVIGFLVVFVSASLASVIGTASGYFGGWFDIIAQRVVDVGIALPGLIFIILVVTTLTQFPPQFISDILHLNPSGEVVFRIAVALGVLVSLGSSRVIRGSAISAKQNVYVEAARVVGATDFRIMVKHIFPNVFAVVLVSASIQVGGAILTESSLSFLGYGVQPPTPSWGRMLNEAREQLTRHPHLAVFPGLAIFLAVYSFNMLGDALRDVLDPRLRGSR